MSNKIEDILNLAKSTLQTEQTPLEIIDLGNGYLLVHTHSQAPDVSDRAQSMGAVDYYEVKHSASEHVLAALTGMGAGEGQPAIIKVGVILPDHKAPGMAKNVFEALTKKYGKCSEDALSFLKTSWGDSEEAPSIEPSDKVGAWKKIHEVLDIFGSLKKSEDDKTQMVKINGMTGWHQLVDIKDSGKPAHEGGGNHYTFIHNKTNEPTTVHQDSVLDLAFAHELKKISYHRRPFVKKAVKNPDHTRVLGVLKSLKKSAAGFPGLQNAGLVGTAAISKDSLSEDMIDGSMLNKTNEDREAKLASLGSETQIGIDPDSGKKAFLLFRGMEKDEYESTVEPNVRVSAEHQATWTPYPDIAMKFSPTGYLVGAWIAEDHLIMQATPPGKQLDPETNRISLYKVIVKPHASQVLNTDQTKMIIKQMQKGSSNA